MFFVMYKHEGEVKLVERQSFTTYEEAEKYAENVFPQYEPFICEKVEVGFRKIKHGTRKENVLMVFGKESDIPCVEAGSFHHEGEELVYSFTDGGELNYKATPTLFAPIPSDEKFVSVAEELSNVPTNKSLLFKFASGQISAGIVEINEDSGRSYYYLWDGDSLVNNPTHYCEMPDFQ